MKRHDKLEQKSIEWFEMKWGKIGGTASSGLFVKSDTLLIDMLSQRIEEFEPEQEWSNSHTERGNELEPFALKYLNSYTGLKFGSSGWLQSEENELLGLSPDGITDDDTIACEIKCFGRKNHLQVLLDNEIPKENTYQCIHYFTVNPKLEKLIFLCFRPESKKHFLKEITLDSTIDIGLKKKIEIEQFGVKGNKIKPKIKTVEDIKTVRELVAMAKESANELLEDMKQKEIELNF